jgi:hypothetical protein
MPPSVRGSGSLIAWEASAFEGLLFSEAAIMTTARRARPTNAMIPNLFIVSPTFDLCRNPGNGRSDIRLPRRSTTPIGQHDWDESLKARQGFGEILQIIFSSFLLLGLCCQLLFSERILFLNIDIIKIWISNYDASIDVDSMLLLH